VITISVKSNIKDLLDHLQLLEKDVRTATAIALTRTAWKVRAAEMEEMPRVFDRPVPFTLNSVLVRQATRESLAAKVWLREEGGKGNAPFKFLEPEIVGGPRRMKRFERAMAGILPPGMMAVPGEGARLDAYGNMSAGQIVQILSQLRIQTVGGYESRLGGKTIDEKKVKRSIKRQGYRIFALVKRHGNLLPGIYARIQTGVGPRGGALTKLSPLLIFVRAVTYHKRFDFVGVAERTTYREFPGEFRRALDERMARARR